MTDIQIFAIIFVGTSLFYCYQWGRIDGLKEARRIIEDCEKKQK